MAGMIPPHGKGKPVGEFADVVLGLILHAQGGEITVPREAVESHRRLTAPQVLTQHPQPDGSIIFRAQDCPVHAGDDDGARPRW